MPKVVGLIGYPLGHSVSPAMQNAAFKKLGLDFEYEPFEVPPRDLEEAVRGMRALHIAGFNVTVPHKETVIPYIDDITQNARIIGAVNTVINQEGRLIGYNTDGAGFIDSLKEDAKFDPHGKSAVLLGAGGAARAISATLAEAKAASLVIADVQEERSRSLSEYIGSYFEMKCNYASPGSRELQTAIEKADLLINATPIGMHPKMNESPIEKGTILHPKLLVYDLVYNPAETKLIIAARSAGCRTCSGLEMLVRQGALAFSLWTGKKAPIEVMRKAARSALK